MKQETYRKLEIAVACKQAEDGYAGGRGMKKGISEATFYNGKKKYGGLGVNERRRLRQLKEENFKLKQIQAALTLNKQMLQDVLKSP